MSLVLIEHKSGAWCQCCQLPLSGSLSSPRNLITSYLEGKNHRTRLAAWQSEANGIRVAAWHTIRPSLRMPLLPGHPQRRSKYQAKQRHTHHSPQRQEAPTQRSPPAVKWRSALPTSQEDLRPLAPQQRQARRLDSALGLQEATGSLRRSTTSTGS